MPYESYEACALALDDKRLGKQRLEARQLLDTLMGKSLGWTNHPATKMWRGHEWWLAEYGIAMCRQWMARGFLDTMLADFESAQRALPKGEEPKFTEALRASMRANLVRKDAKRYRDFLGFTEDPKDGYAWPTTTD